RAGPSATFVDPLSLGSIEISRGPGSVAYGSDALGGVVHLRPRDPIPGQPEVRYDAWASFGGTEARAVAGEGSMDLLGGAILASIHTRSADDGQDGNGDPILNSGYEDRGALLRFVRDSSWGRMRIGLMSSSARDVGAPTSDTVLTLYPEEDANLLTFALDIPKVSVFDSASVRASIGSYEITTNRIRTTGIESAEVKARDGSVRLSGERATERTRIVTGVDFVSRFNLRAPGSIDDADRYDTGLFATWESRVSRAVQLAAGGRLDYVATRNHGGYFGDASIDDTALSGFGAATVGPFNGITATLQVSSGYREPTLSDRYFRGISGRGFVVGNPLLEPERSVQVDAGVRWSGARSRVALFGYHYKISDLVERFRNGADFNFRNRGEATIHGFELETATRLMQDIELIAGAAIARGEADGADLDDIAAPSLHASVRWAAENKSAFFGASLVGRDDRPGPVETTRAGYTSLDAGAGWRFTPWLEVRVVVRNLTDAQRFGSPDAVAAFAPGRSFTIGINR
ncbi:MAG TPA: TonB-dependent receptor, partial [Thermoanaerobaculia bacterium]